MLMRNELPPRFREWNRQWHAPFGKDGLRLGRVKLPFDERDVAAITELGMFSLQPNSDSRLLEYPWAFFATELPAPLRVLEIGGGLSGFQFVLSKLGHEVENVDPGSEQFDVPVNAESIGALNRIFGTHVTLHACTIESAALPEGAYDRVFSLSVLEHLPPEAIRAALDRAHAALKAGGLMVLTVDLFLDLVPFSKRESNKWGRNVPLGQLIDARRFELVHGVPAELYGFGAFDAERVMASLADVYIARAYPALIQTLVLRRL